VTEARVRDAIAHLEEILAGVGQAEPEQDDDDEEKEAEPELQPVTASAEAASLLAAQKFLADRSIELAGVGTFLAERE
jgi:hypothetical protein